MVYHSLSQSSQTLPSVRSRTKSLRRRSAPNELPELFQQGRHRSWAWHPRKARQAARCPISLPESQLRRAHNPLPVRARTMQCALAQEPQIIVGMGIDLRTPRASPQEATPAGQAWCGRVPKQPPATHSTRTPVACPPARVPLAARPLPGSPNAGRRIAMSCQACKRPYQVRGAATLPSCTPRTQRGSAILNAWQSSEAICICRDI
eukprot:8021851-Pyramimonas_sp.AAC.2